MVLAQICDAYGPFKQADAWDVACCARGKFWSKENPLKAGFGWMLVYLASCSSRWRSQAETISLTSSISGSKRCVSGNLYELAKRRNWGEAICASAEQVTAIFQAKVFHNFTTIRSWRRAIAAIVIAATKFSVFMICYLFNSKPLRACFLVYLAGVAIAFSWATVSTGLPLSCPV